MSEDLLIGITAVIVLGISASWLAWRLRLPSILLLLIVGFVSGPVLGLIQPDQLLGDLLFPIVSLAVAFILYEGGLTLNFHELRRVGGVVLRLVTIGTLVTWLIGTAAAYYLLNLDLSLALLLGALLVVTGPTVVGPLLQQVRPKGEVAATLKWEGILIDPIGALLAVLVFEVIIEGELHQAPALILQGVLIKLLIGVAIGLAAAGILLLLLKRFWIPDHLQNGVSVLVVLAAFATANVLHEESGLLSVTLMGIVLANQNWVAVRHIVEFKENLRVMLIATLFILLAARLQLADFAQLGFGVVLFLAVLVFLARPLSVLLSTFGSELNWRERGLIAWIAPRGIVAAAVSAIFALRLTESGHSGAQQLAPLTFLVIVGTVLLYGLTAKPLARWLNVTDEDPQGMLILGAHPFARQLALAFQAEGVRTLLLDSNWHNVTQARLEGLDVQYGNALAEYMLDDLNLNGIGRFLALTTNDEANALVALHFAELFGRSEVYQLPIRKEKDSPARESSPLHLQGRLLFGRTMTYHELEERMESGSVIKVTPITKTFRFHDFKEMYQDQAIPLFLIDKAGVIAPWTVTEPPTPQPGDRIMSLVDGNAIQTGRYPVPQAKVTQEPTIQPGIAS